MSLDKMLRRKTSNIWMRMFGNSRWQLAAERSEIRNWIARCGRQSRVGLRSKSGFRRVLVVRANVG